MTSVRVFLNRPRICLRGPQRGCLREETSEQFVRPVPFVTLRVDVKRRKTPFKISHGAFANARERSDTARHVGLGRLACRTLSNCVRLSEKRDAPPPALTQLHPKAEAKPRGRDPNIITARGKFRRVIAPSLRNYQHARLPNVGLRLPASIQLCKLSA